jgi:hypothetical protein
LAADASATAPGVDGKAGIRHVCSWAGVVGVERGRADDGTGIEQDEGQVRRGLHPVRPRLVLRDVARPAEGLSSMGDLAQDGPNLDPILERCVCSPHGIRACPQRVRRAPLAGGKSARAVTGQSARTMGCLPAEVWAFRTGPVHDQSIRLRDGAAHAPPTTGSASERHAEAGRLLRLKSGRSAVRPAPGHIA